MQHFADGGEVQWKKVHCNTPDEYYWRNTVRPDWNFIEYEYRIKPYEYPLFFKDNQDEGIWKFTSLHECECIKSRYINSGHKYLSQAPHTDKNTWTQIEEPKPDPEFGIGDYIRSELCLKYIYKIEGVISINGDISYYTTNGNTICSENAIKWGPEHKEPVWCFTRDTTQPVLRFWDSQTERPFLANLGRAYNNLYYKVTPYFGELEDWMIERQKLLED